MKARVRAAALSTILVLSGCGSAGEAVVAGSATTSSPPATLRPSAVAYLPSSAKALSTQMLARETHAPGLVGELRGWNYVSGAERYFQGESRQLQVVDSRTLRFRAASGASAYLGFARAHTAAYLGSFASARGFASRGRRGFLAVAQPCQCHLANPAYLAAVRRGGTVSWLLINGPGATPRRLAALLAQAP